MHCIGAYVIRPYNYPTHIRTGESYTPYHIRPKLQYYIITTLHVIFFG